MKKMILSILIITAIFCSACEHAGITSNIVPSPTPIPVTNEEGLVTAEYVLANSDLTVDDVRGVAIDDVIWMLGIDIRKYKKKPFREWIEVYKKKRFYQRSSKLSYLKSNPAQEGKYVGNGDDIYLVLLHVNPDIINKSWLYNFQENKILMSNGASEYASYSEAPLSEDVENNIRTLVVDNVLNWEKEYNGRFAPNSTESFGWNFIIETIDGKIYRYEGSGIYDAKPEGFDEFAKQFASYSSMPLN